MDTTTDRDVRHIKLSDKQQRLLVLIRGYENGSPLNSGWWRTARSLTRSELMVSGGAGWMISDRGRAWLDHAAERRTERLIVEARDRIAALTVADLTDEMIGQAISGATEPCPKCGDLILRGCGRHLAKHAEVPR